jgi:hypothetical protein
VLKKEQAMLSGLMFVICVILIARLIYPPDNRY